MAEDVLDDASPADDFGPNGEQVARFIEEVKKLLASDAQAADLFGVSAAVSGGTTVVGASQEDAEGSLAGAAYIFQRDEGGVGNCTRSAH